MSTVFHSVRRLFGVVSTDDIIPARYKHMHTDPDLLAPHIFEAFAPGFVDTVRSGDVLVGDSLFGIGSSREQAVSALAAAGFTAVIAPRFGRIFFRNCWNLAVPAIEVDTALLVGHDSVGLDLDHGHILDRDGNVVVDFVPPPSMLIEMVRAGGLLRTLARSL